MKEILRRCLEKLEPGERQVIEARLEGIQPAAIAARAKVDPKRVHKVFFRAKAKLRACVEQAKR
jgi:DNA-directed RNA polymerase specialized sigma24 family protein